MKRALCLIFALVMCLTLCACGDDEVPDGTQKPFPEHPLVIQGIDGNGYLNIERLNEIIEVVELTTDNWRDYIKVHPYTEEKVSYDAFGEVTSTETVVHYLLGVGEDRYHQFDNVIIELKNKSNGELSIHRRNQNEGGGPLPSVSADFDIDDYECTRIKGTVYFVDLPEEVIWREGNNTYFGLGGGLANMVYPIFSIVLGKTISCNTLLPSLCD